MCWGILSFRVFGHTAESQLAVFVREAEIARVVSVATTQTFQACNSTLEQAAVVIRKLFHVELRCIQL